MMCSAYKLNKQGDSIQPWRTPFPIWNQSVVPCPVLTVASWPAYRFLKRQVRWSGILIFLEEAQAGIKTAGRNINNIRNADDTTFMVDSEEEVKSLLMKVKEENKKDGLKLNIQKTKIMASSPITWWNIDGETAETVADFILGGSTITADGDCSHEIKLNWVTKEMKIKTMIYYFFTYILSKIKWNLIIENAA